MPEHQSSPPPYKVYAQRLLHVYGRDELCEMTDGHPCWGLRADDTDGWRQDPCDVCKLEEAICVACGEGPRPQWTGKNYWTEADHA